MAFVGNLGQGNVTPLRPVAGRSPGRIQGAAAQGVAYPSPFFDVAHTYLPATKKALFRWCRYYFLTNPLINATVFKLSEYPITDIVVDHEVKETKTKWTEYFQDQLRWRAFQVESGLDFFCYGNAFFSLSFPFRKMIRCVGCQNEFEATKHRSAWVFTNFQFRLTCPRCGHIGDATVRDWYLRNASGIRILRWNPEDIEINYNDVTGESTYYYYLPPNLRADIVSGRKDVVDGVPQVFIQAMRENKGVIFSKDNLFHMKRPTLATEDRGWGTPLLLPVLKDTFYLQLMKKAQEAILLEHIVPLRVLFPQAGSGSSDPYTSVNLLDWRDQVAAEIARWRLDNNYIPILPLPVGNQTLGGDGRALLLTGEIQQWSEHIMVGMGVPREFLLGGMSYSGTNVSLRMLENMFLGYLIGQKALARFVMKQIAAYMGWPEVSIRYKPFKMADDIQRKAFRLQLNQAGKISDTTLLADDDLSQENENEIMLRETDMRIEATKKQQLAMATVQGEAQLIMAKFQAKAQQVQMAAMQTPVAPGEPGGPEMQHAGGAPGAEESTPMTLPPELQVQGAGGEAVQVHPGLGAGLPDAGPAPSAFLGAVSSQLTGQQRMQNSQNVDLPSLAMAQAKLLATLPAKEQATAVQNLALQSPELADLVRQMLQSLRQPGQRGGGVDGRPLPEQRPERRLNPSV